MRNNYQSQGSSNTKVATQTALQDRKVLLGRMADVREERMKSQLFEPMISCGDVSTAACTSPNRTVKNLSNSSWKQGKGPGGLPCGLPSGFTSKLASLSHPYGLSASMNFCSALRNGATRKQTSKPQAKADARVEECCELKTEITTVLRPTRKSISISMHISEIDNVVAFNCIQKEFPAGRAVAMYADAAYFHMLQLETRLPEECYGLSFIANSPLEKLRTLAMDSIFRYALSNGICQSTIHTAALNINRIIYDMLTRACIKGMPSDSETGNPYCESGTPFCTSAQKLGQIQLSEGVFVGLVLAALRSAVKVDENIYQSDKFRYNKNHIIGCIIDTPLESRSPTLKKINEMEVYFLSRLRSPVNPPSSVEFLRRYLEVGEWPQTFRDDVENLACYLCGLGLTGTSRPSTFNKIRPSLMAAATLALSVKVINGEQSHPLMQYEWWPERLQLYTGFTYDKIKHIVYAISALLRTKPPQGRMVDRYFAKWGEYEWS